MPFEGTHKKKDYDKLTQVPETEFIGFTYRLKFIIKNGSSIRAQVKRCR